jgi:hypothetical protein
MNIKNVLKESIPQRQNEMAMYSINITNFTRAIELIDNSPVQEVTPPSYNYATQNLSSDAVLQGSSWVQVWTVSSASPDEIQQRRTGQEASVRAQRDQLLHTNVDTFNAMRWEALDDADKQLWRTYRQALLNVPQQAGFPWNVVWPELP